MRSALPELRSVAQVAQPAPDERACPIDRACVRGAAAACATAGGHVGAIGPASAREDVEAIACSRATSRSTVAEHSRLADGDDASANATGRLEGRCEHTGLAITRTRDTGHSELANASAGSREGASTRASPSRTDATLATASLSSRRDSDAADDAQTRQPPRRLCPRGAHHTLSATKFSPRTCRTLRRCRRRGPRAHGARGAARSGVAASSTARARVRARRRMVDAMYEGKASSMRRSRPCPQSRDVVEYGRPALAPRGLPSRIRECVRQARGEVRAKGLRDHAQTRQPPRRPAASRRDGLYRRRANAKLATASAASARCRARRARVASTPWCPRVQPAGTSKALARSSRRARRRHGRVAGSEEL